MKMGSRRPPGGIFGFFAPFSTKKVTQNCLGVEFWPKKGGPAFSKNRVFFEVFFGSCFWALFGRLLGGKNVKNEVKIVSRREVEKKIEFSESGVLLREKLGF